MTAINKTKKALKGFNRFLITSHINPEGDSLGSQLAMANLLESLGKECVIYNNDRVPAHYLFLPGSRLIRQALGGKKKKFDAAIVLDCPNLRRTGRVMSAVKKCRFIFNIDHHVSNERFGDLNWIETGASSVGEMIFTLHKKMNCEITKETALYIYIAILTDTGSFNYSNTSRATHEIVSELLAHGIAPYDVSKSIYESKAIGDIRLLGRVLSGLKVSAGGKLAYIVVRKKLFKNTGTTPLACENFVNFARSVKGVEVAVFFREDMKKKGYVHVSMRSGKKIDVNRIASFFGGGGHRSASGCTVRGNFENVKKKVLSRIKSELKRRHNPGV